METFNFEKDDIFSLHAREDLFLRNSNSNILTFSILEKPSISLGRLQNYEDVSEQAIKDEIPIARRNTGGRFMYLDNECLIISLIFSEKSISSLSSYETFCDILTKTLKKITHEDFFIKDSNDIMHSSGKKIGGAAQNKISFEGKERILFHSYIRHGISRENLFKYCKVGGISLENYVSELGKEVTSLNEVSKNLSFENFYLNISKVLKTNLSNYFQEDIKEAIFNLSQREKLEKIKKEYLKKEYIHGAKTYFSRGHCDAISGSGNSSVLKIKELNGKVSYS